MGALEDLATYTATLHLNDVPEDVIDRLRWCMLDCIGVAAAGRAAPAAAIMRAFARRTFGGDDATVFGETWRLTSPGAALANATMASAVDMDDGSRLALGHPGAVVIPAALAVAEPLRSSGADLVAALAAGYEVGLRAGWAFRRDRRETYCTGNWGAIGAAASAARLLGLDAQRTTHALRLAAIHGPQSALINDTYPISMAKESIGWAAMAGVSAAFLAADGFEGPAHATPSEDYDQARLGHAIGRDYLIRQLYFKRYSACRWTHAPMDGLELLQQRDGLHADAVRRITVRTFAQAVALNNRRPRTTEEAQYSIPFTMAAYLLKGRVGPAEVAPGALGDPDVLALADRVDVVLDEALERLFPAQTAAIVEVTTDRGTLSARIDYPVGNYEHPFSPEQYVAKFDWLATPVFGRERATAIKATTARLESLGDVRALTSLLAAAPTPAAAAPR